MNEYNAIRLSPVTSAELDYFRSIGWNADKWAIATESERCLDVFAGLASSGTMSYSEVKGHVLDSHNTYQFDDQYLARLARIVVVRSLNPDDIKFAGTAFRLTFNSLKGTNTFRRIRNIAYDTASITSDFTLAQEILDAEPTLAKEYFHYRSGDLINPFVTANFTTFTQWLKYFNAPFKYYQMSELTLNKSVGQPFDSVECLPLEAPPYRSTKEYSSLSEDNPLVTVILTTFNPSGVELQHSLNSILNQTWKNLELLIVDDASTEMPLNLDEITQSDPRLRVLRLSTNGGTYRARNAGLNAARGVYVTGQDTDDWSHPERIERQLLAIHDNPNVIGVLGQAIRTDERLQRTTLGFAPNRRCEVSLMFRRHDGLDIGGYLPLRKAADSEFKERLHALKGGVVKEIPDPVYLTRLSKSSLSRSDFRHGWTHSARESFTSSYRHWHHQLAKSLRPHPAGLPSSAPLSQPAKVSGRNISEILDVCFVADWSLRSEIARSALAEIHALLQQDFKVGIIHIASPLNYRGNPKSLIPEIQQLINDGIVTLIDRTDIATAKLLIIRDPSTLMYASHERFQLNPQKAIIVAEDPLATTEHDFRIYEPSSVNTALHRIFHVSAAWYLPHGVQEDEYSNLVRLDNYKGTYPTVVEATINRPSKHFGLAPPFKLCSELRATVSDYSLALSHPNLFSATESYEHWILGEAKLLYSTLGMRRPPFNMLTFESYEILAPKMLQYMDVYLSIDAQPHYKPPRRLFLEACANGTPTLALEESQHANYEQAWRIDGKNIQHALSAMQTDAELLDEKLCTGGAWVKQNFGAERFIDFIEYFTSDKTETVVSK